jgi:hypothetical protein
MQESGNGPNAKCRPDREVSEFECIPDLGRTWQFGSDLTLNGHWPVSKVSVILLGLQRHGQPSFGTDLEDCEVKTHARGHSSSFFFSVAQYSLLTAVYGNPAYILIL